VRLRIAFVGEEVVPVHRQNRLDSAKIRSFYKKTLLLQPI
jgi:hypothetical protein